MIANLLAGHSGALPVCSIDLPPFPSWPKVLLWGDRAFVLSYTTHRRALRPEQQEAEYVEAFSYHVPHQPPQQLRPMQPARCWCGEKGPPLVRCSAGGWQVRCLACRCSAQAMPTREEAVTDWNTRQAKFVEPDPPMAQDGAP